MKNLKIKFFQFCPKFLDLENNFLEIGKLLEKNKEEILNSDLIIFPEYFLSGSCNTENFSKYEKLYQKFNLLQNCKNLSKKYSNQTFVMGTFFEKQENGKYLNKSYVLKNGEILTSYSKKGLVYDENQICERGENIGIFEINSVKCGILICWDIFTPEFSRKYIGKIDLLIIPAFWGIGGNILQNQYKFSLEKKYYSALGISRAYENGFALLFVNAVGKYSGNNYEDFLMGGSYFINPPFGKIFSVKSENSNDFHKFEIFFKDLKRYRKFYKPGIENIFYRKKGII